MECLHKNCKKKVMELEKYCWDHISLYYTQKIRDYDPDDEDHRIIKACQKKIRI